MQVYLVRHGETHKNGDKKNGSRNKDKNSDLNIVGTEQSVLTGKVINKSITTDQKCLIVHSPILRTDNTARRMYLQIKTNVEIIHDERIANCVSKDNDVLLANLLSLLQELYERHRDKLIILVTHNHVIESAYKHALNSVKLDVYKVGNCSITQMTFDGTDLTVNDFNRQDHLNNN